MDFPVDFKKAPIEERIKLVRDVTEAIEIQIKTNKAALGDYLDSAESRLELLQKVVTRYYEDKTGTIDSILHSILNTNS